MNICTLRIVRGFLRSKLEWKVKSTYNLMYNWMNMIWVESFLCLCLCCVVRSSIVTRSAFKYDKYAPDLSRSISWVRICCCTHVRSIIIWIIATNISKSTFIFINIFIENTLNLFYEFLKISPVVVENLTEWLLPIFWWNSPQMIKVRPFWVTF